jgi:hypothetical protein
VPKQTPREALVALVQPALDNANATAPSHSQLAAETLVFLPFDTVIPRADKGSFLRPKVYAAFKDVIDGVYAALEGDAGTDSPKRSFASVEEALSFVHDVVHSTIGGDHATLEATTDLFDYGLDSLQASRIRNALLRVSRSAGKQATNWFADHSLIRASTSAAPS